MTQRSEVPDRRRAYRVQPANAVARCSSKTVDGLYAVHDLSRGGVALNGKPPLRAGTKVGIRLIIPGYESMSLRGTVLRSIGGPRRSTRVAVGFGDLDADNEDIIGNVIVGELARGALPRCLIASSSERERKVLARRLSQLGVQVLQASTPMEVIHRLETSSHRVDAIVIGGQIGDCDGVEFASFVAGAYPTMRRVLSGRPAGRRAQLARHVAHVSLNGRWGADDLRLALLSRTGFGQR